MKKKIKLFCLPYAGGSACSIYSKWNRDLDVTIELHPVELSGRGLRITENIYLNVEEAVEDVVEKIRDEIIDCDYAIFGHSMGSILTYKVLQRINDLKLPSPIHSFFSGRRAPNCKSREPVPHSTMSIIQLEEEIKELGITPTEFFQNQEIKNIFMPIIKSDFNIADTFVEKSEMLVLNHDISIFLGKNEDVTTHEANEWMQYTNKNCSIEYFDGGHFFLLDQTKAVTTYINDCLTKNCQHISVS
ncbi:thioesterase domain-containing protein [Aquimarina addita]|uniref:Thioesterase domain-containing protein n=1 Tax=Aquimarina addita TaxID=870485 RepID=A0ABP7XG37_9FLAO